MPDDELQRDVAEELSWDTKVDTEVPASVAEQVGGVTHVHNDIGLTDNTAEAGDVRPFIEWAMQRAAQLDARKVTAETREGIVTLTGSVSSWAEHDAAVAVAWATPGVTAVYDRIDVRY